ncbi:MAG: MFS transporter [Phycisphaeraceae bacterium]|nr:MAG: MFS transporter [Phycisphaeraceae bacterium]
MNEPRASSGSPLHALLRIAVDVKPHEVAALGWSWLYLFCLMSGYYVLRPLRDEIGSVRGADDLPWLYTATFFTMLAAVPAFSWLVARYSRRTFIPLVYRFFNLNLMLFFLALTLLPEDASYPVALAFYVWVSVYNLFVVAVFWGFMADLFRSDQGKRLFGFIAFGASFGGVMGGLAVSALAEPLGRTPLMLVTIVLLEAAVWCVSALMRQARRVAGGEGDTKNPHPGPLPGGEGERAGGEGVTPAVEAPIRGTMWAGFTTTLASPYLLGIVAYVFLYTYTSTVLYYQQAELVNVTFESRDARAAFFARIDVAVNALSLLCQAFLTGRVMKRLGVALTLTILPAVTAAGFLLIGWAAWLDLGGGASGGDAGDAAGGAWWWGGVPPIVAVFVGVQVLRRAGNFAFGKPARDVLYTIVPREDKYKAKSFIDTAVYRGGDVLSGWCFAGMQAIGLGAVGISFITAPLAMIWGAVAIGLGARFRRAAHPPGQSADAARSTDS